MFFDFLKQKQPTNIQDVFWKKCGINVDSELYVKMMVNLKMCVEFLKNDSNLSKGPMNFLSDISISIWESFFSPLAIQLFHARYLSFIDKLHETYIDETQNLTFNLYKNVFISSLKTILEIMDHTSIDIDLIFFIKVSILLGSIYETFENDQEASEVYHGALNKILKFRQSKHARKLRGIEETPLYMDVSCNPAKIKHCWTKMMKTLSIWQLKMEEQLILQEGKDERIERVAKSITSPLTPPTEELLELMKLQKRQELKKVKRIFFPSQVTDFTKFLESVKSELFNPYNTLLTSLQQEIFISYSRTKVKANLQNKKAIENNQLLELNKNTQVLLEKIKTSTIKEQEFQQKNGPFDATFAEMISNEVSFDAANFKMNYPEINS